MNLRRAGRRLDLRLARAFAAISDIIADRIVEEDHVLRHDADGGAQGLLGHGRYVLPVDRHRSRLNVVEAEEDARDGGLARA